MKRLIDYLPFLVFPLVWIIQPLAHSPYIDDADTQGYAYFLGTVGYRIPITTIVHFFVTWGLTPMHAALFLNTLAIFYLFYLLRYPSSSKSFRGNWFHLGIIASSPLLVLAKNNLVTDLYAGLFFTHYVLLCEKTCLEITEKTPIPNKRFFVLALLELLAVNIKETVILPFFIYALLFLFLRRKLLKVFIEPTLKFFVIWLLLWCAMRIPYYLIYQNPFYDYSIFLFKSKGGNTPSEIIGARTSIPVPLFLFHIFSHLKIVGRYGIAGFCVLLSLWWFRKRLYGQFYALALGVFTVIGINGYLVLEKYWALFVPIQLLIFKELQFNLLQTKRFRQIGIILFLVAWLVSSANYVFRYFPEVLNFIKIR